MDYSQVLKDTKLERDTPKLGSDESNKPETNFQDNKLENIEKAILKSENTEKFSCTDCNKTYSSKINLKIHLNSKLHQPEKRYQCGHCKKRFSLPLYLKRHKLRHVNSNESYKCAECFKKFYRLADYLIHKKRHLKTNLKCGICSRSFISQRRFELHKCQLTFDCYCKKSYTSKKSLKLHQETHVKDKCYKCNFCDKMFSLKRYLVSHMAFHRSISEAVVCNICYKKFPRKSNLRNHMKTHKSLECGVCNEPFNRMIDLLMHKKVHRKVNPCDICGKSFKTLSYLKRHKDNHGKELVLHKCDSCSAKFRCASLLDRHKALKHEKSRQHCCQHCNQTFISIVKLALHSKTHQKHNLEFNDAPGLIGFLNYNISF